MRSKGRRCWFDDAGFPQSPERVNWVRRPPGWAAAPECMATGQTGPRPHSRSSLSVGDATRWRQAALFPWPELTRTDVRDRVWRASRFDRLPPAVSDPPS